MKPLWILTTPRCGSTYLCDILNNTKLFDIKIKENFNFKSETKNQIVKYTKVHFYQLIECNKSKINPEQNFPDIKYVRIIRKDLFRQAISDYCARKSMCWQVTNLDNSFEGDFNYITLPRKKYLEIKFNWDEKLAVSIYEKLVEDNKSWDNFLVNRSYLIVDYDDVVNNTKKTIKNIFNYIDCEISENLILKSIKKCKTVEVNHPNYDYFVEKLKNKIAKKTII